jgi:hypothetical protein
MYGLGFHVFFPTFIIEVDTATDCHLHYSPVGWSAGLPDLNFVQLMSCHNALASTTSATSPSRVTIEPDDNINPNGVYYASHYPKRPPSPVPPAINRTATSLQQFTKRLRDMNKADLHNLLSTDPMADTPPTPVDAPKRNAPKPLLSMNETNIRELLHHPGLSQPPIWPCDTLNPSVIKSHWTAKELHRITGSRRFRNYKHLMAVSKDSTYINNGKFSISIGAFTTIPKVPQGKPIDRLPLKYLVVVHVNIAFGNCLSVGGFKYLFIFVDQATRYNWWFWLKPLQHEDIISAFLAFCSEAGRLPTQFCCNCDKKLFGSHICSFLHLKRSSIISSPVGHQSANGLVVFHWKIMVHMS